MEELQNTLDVQTSWDPTAAEGKAENVVHLRFVNELKKNGFIDRLYNEGQVKSSDKSFPSGRYHGSTKKVFLLATENKFKCPCHGSGFYKDGLNFEGPAPRPLDRFQISLAEDGQLLVDIKVIRSG